MRYPSHILTSILGYLLLPKAVDTTPKISTTEIRDREHSSRLSALSNFSIGEIFRDVRDGSKSVKFPEKLLKVLELKLQNISMGKDPGCAIVSPIYVNLGLTRQKLLGSTATKDDG